MRKKFISNLLVAFLSQGVSLAMSLLMSLLLPKLLGVNQYSYSQLFVFYIGYVGFFHFGVNDGIYLRLGGKDFNTLDKRKLGTEYKLFILFELLIGLLVSAIGVAVSDDPSRKIIFIVAGVYLILNNLTLYLGYIFQAVNETKWFSISVMIDRIFVIVFITLLLLFKQDSYLPFIITYTVSKAIALLYCTYKGRSIVFSKLSNIRHAISDMWADASVGIKLTISNIVAMLVLGVGRMIIDKIWGIESFGKVSLSFSLTNFFLVFIQQVSMVMFPALRKIESEKQKDIFVTLRSGINMIAPVILVLYIPMQYLLGLWLPQYQESLYYLAFLLPICIFDGKMQMLFTTYFKVLRKEKLLMYINMSCLAISAILCSISGFVVHNMTAVVASMVIAVISRSIISDVILAKEFGTLLGKEFILELLLIVVYISIVSILSSWTAFALVALAYLIYLAINRKEVMALIDNIRHGRLMKS